MRQRLFLAAALTALSLPSLAGAAALVEGQDYQVLASPVETQVANDQIELTEVFWYGCPHCYTLQEHLEGWYPTLEDDVAVVHLPATMGGDWNTHAQVFYAAEALGIREAAHADIFHAIHEEGRALTDLEDVAAFFGDYGVDADAAREALDAFAVKAQVNKAHNRLRAMRLRGVPALLIDGRYLVNAQTAGSLENVPKVAEALIDKVREARAD